MMKTPPAWQEILLLNYRERLAAALSEMDVKIALEQALRDTALDVAGSGSIAEPAEMGGSLFDLPRRRRRRRPPP